jgi:hypothetical protein
MARFNDPYADPVGIVSSRWHNRSRRCEPGALSAEQHGHLAHARGGRHLCSRLARLEHLPRQVAGTRSGTHHQPAIGDGTAHVRVHLGPCEHVVGARGHHRGLGRREALGRDQAQAVEPHGLHGAGGRADVAGMRDTGEHDAD